jgi:hypothetical protein
MNKQPSARFLDFTRFKKQASEIARNVSTEGLSLLAVLILHASTIPSLLAVMSGLSDSLLPVDMVLMVWAGLGVLFLKAAVQRDFLILITIGLGFVAQSVLMALTFFK